MVGEKEKIWILNGKKARLHRHLVNEFRKQAKYLRKIETEGKANFRSNHIDLVAVKAYEKLGGSLKEFDRFIVSPEFLEAKPKVLRSQA